MHEERSERNLIEDKNGFIREVACEFSYQSRRSWNDGTSLHLLLLHISFDIEETEEFRAASRALSVAHNRESAYVGKVATSCSERPC